MVRHHRNFRRTEVINTLNQEIVAGEMTIIQFFLVTSATFQKHNQYSYETGYTKDKQQYQYDDKRIDFEPTDQGC